MARYVIESDGTHAVIEPATLDQALAGEAALLDLARALARLLASEDVQERASSASGASRRCDVVISDNTDRREWLLGALRKVALRQGSRGPLPTRSGL